MAYIAPTRPAAADAPQKADPTRSKRLDIQALRAIAVLAVVVDHVGVFSLPGGFVGVDIFFVISGFLITGHLVRSARRDRSVGYAEFYANRIRRLVPAATVALIASAVITRLFVPWSRWEATFFDIVGSAFYVENWVLSERAVDYMSQDTLPSPVQHFWSLAVEEQFYIVWPLMIGLVTWAFLGLARRTKRGRGVSSFQLLSGERYTVALAFGLTLIAAPSLVWSILYAASAPEKAYFVTTTRLWELAVGGLIAVGASKIARIKPIPAAALTWVGLGGIATSFFVIGPDTPFPGYAALLPTLSTAAVIIGGFGGGKWGPGLLLSNRLVQLVGDMSYSIYLWHWPVIIAVLAQQQEISLAAGLALVAVSLILGYLSYRLIENPTRRARWWADDSWRAIGAGLTAGTLSLFVAFGLLWIPMQDRIEDAFRSQADVLGQIEDPSRSGELAKVGAGVLPAEPRDSAEGEPIDSFPTLVPDPGRAPTDYMPYKATKIGDSEVTPGRYGDLTGTTEVALVGDSHAAQWLSALDPIAKARGWRLTTYFHDSCPFANGPLLRDGERYTDCIEWNEGVAEQLLEFPPAAVIATNYTDAAAASGGDKAMIEAYRAAWRPLLASDVPVVVIRDNPRPGSRANIAECAAVNTSSLSECAFPRDIALDPQGADHVAAASRLDGVTLVDLSDAICPTDPCAAAIGGVLIYRDVSHITGTYIATLRPRLEEALGAVPALAAAPTPSVTPSPTR